MTKDEKHLLKGQCMKPMLACTVVEEKLDFPYHVSPKLDGIRCIIKDGVALSRSLKPIPNEYIQSVLGRTIYNGFDGEIIIGAATDPNVMQNTTKGVMTQAGTPAFTYYVFDAWDKGEEDYNTRFFNLLLPQENLHLKFLPSDVVNNVKSLEEYEKAVLTLGFEGVVLRKPTTPYQFGRSTMKQGSLLKLKRFMDSEAKIIGFVEEMHNTNEATKDALGNTKRSSHKENKIGKDVLGALIVEDCESGVKFQIGSGFTAPQRKEIWYNAKALYGAIVTYKHFPIGVKDAPRFPTFKCFRHKDDLCYI